MPVRANALRQSLSQKALAERMTDSQFTARYGPRFMNKCVADQLRATYADGCREQMAKFRKNSALYCQCMLDSLNALPDADIAQMGKESSEYIPKAVEAKKRNAPPPAKPPAVQRFTSMDAMCTAK
jgi:hypothetical protein